MSDDQLAALDELACAQQLARVFARLDRRDFQGVANCFTCEGVWYRQGAELTGPQQVLDALLARPRHLLFVQHILHEVSCEPAGEGRMKGSAYMTVYRKDPPEPITPPLPPQVADMVLRWEIDFAREDGAWRIARLENFSLYR